MTQEEKDLLLKDLSTRVPYGVMFYYNNNEPLKVEGIVRNVVYFKGYNYQTEGDECYASITECKPYLRPMSSMTKEEFTEYEKANDLDTLDSSETLRENMKAKSRVRISKWYHGTDWLNAHHFDYRGLIEKELALEAPKNMYNYG